MRRKRQKTAIAYENEVKVEDLLNELVENRKQEEEDEDEEEEEEEDVDVLYAEEEEPDSESQLTEPEDEEEEERAQASLQFMLLKHDPNCVDSPADGVYYFKAGDIGASRILQYRLRPPIQQVPSNCRQEFVFQLRGIDYQRGWRTQIRIFGVTPTHYSVIVNVYGFEPYFFVRWPWNDPEAQSQLIAEFLQTLERMLEEKYGEPSAVKRYVLKRGIETRGYVEGTALYLQIYLRCPSLVSKARRIIESNEWPYADYVSATYESDIEYVLRYMTDQDYGGECTLCIRAGKYRFRSMAQAVTHMDVEIEVPDYRDIALAKEQLSIPYETTMSFDAEMKSMRGNFPVPSQDPVISVACHSIMNDDESKCNTVCFSLGSSNSIHKRHPTADVLCYEREVDMMLGWRLYVLVVDPDILTGYNIINFDLSYFLERAETLKHVDPRATQIPYISRIIKFKCVVKEDRKEDRAHGIRQNKKIYLPGRIQIDMLTVMGEFKLRSYTLNNVSKIFLGNEKEDMSYALIPEKHKTREGRTELNSYCVKDALLPYKLMAKLRTKLKFYRKARVTGVTIEALVTRGLGFQGKSVVYRKFQRQHPRIMIYVRTEAQRVQDMLNPSYGGAHVEKPLKGYYTVPIATLDFSSLYPSNMIAYNMCVTTIITVAYARRRNWKRASLHGDGSDGDYFQIPGFKSEGKVAQLEQLFHSGQSLDGLYSDEDTCFVTPKHKEGIIPMILKAYLAERKSVKRQMAEHEETKERMREYAADLVKSKEELLSLLESYRSHASSLQAKLQQDNRPDKLKLQKDLARLLWKIEQLVLRVHDSIEARQECAKECLSKAEVEEFLEILADLFQLEIKLCGNSMYGLFGAKTSFLYCMPLAAAVTSIGQFMILLTKLEVEKKFCKANGYPMDSKVVYGDSVISTTPILVRFSNGEMMYRCVADLPRQSDWTPYPGGKEYAFPVDGMTVWTSKGFSRVKYLIRHKTEKKLLRVTTHTGSVTVTEDHSLLRANGACVKPSELSVGEHLLTSPLPIHCVQQQHSCALAWVWGFFFADGSCGCYQQKSGNKATWAINKLDMSLLEKAQSILKQVHPDLEFPILDTVASSGVYKLQLRAGKGKYGAVVNWVREWRTMFYCERTRTKHVPDILWKADVESRRAFLEGYYAGDGDKIGPGKRFDVKGEIGAAGLYFLAASLGYSVSVNTRVDKSDIYRLTLTTSKQRKAVGVVKAIHDTIPTYKSDDSSDYVFDLETENHEFAAGPGQVNVHNTDSIMVKMDGVSREQARELGMEMSAFASALWPAPHKLEAEKIFQPSLFVKKKKYAAYVYMMDPMTGGLKDPKVKSSGLDTVRRDNCKFTTEVMDTALNLLMTDTEGQGVERSIAFIQEQVALLLQGKVSFFKLIISKQLRRDNYVNPSVHSVLAARLGKRAGERIAYVIKKMAAGSKLYMCGEDPDIAFRSGAPLDYDYYLKKQLMEPIIRLFAPVLAPHLDMDIKEHEKPIRRIVIHRIFSGPHMWKRLLTVDKEKIERMGIFSIVPTCTGCKRTLKPEEKEYCASCKVQRGAALVKTLRAELEELSDKNLCHWRQCQACMEVEVATHIVCDQNDCQNYWDRRKTTVDLTRVSDLLASLSF